MLLAQAPDLNAIQSRGLQNFKNFNTPADIINAILPYVFGAAGIALLIYLVLGGLQLMLAKGDPKAIQAAQSKITNAIIGFIIVAIAYTLTQLVGRLLGIGQFTTIFH